jgi:hypothetical protein
MIQPIKDRVHPTYEYWGQSDPTHEINRKVSKEEMVTRVSQMYSGKVKVKKCPKAVVEEVDLPSQILRLTFRSFASFSICLHH